MITLPNHTVTINGMGFFGQQCKSTAPFSDTTNYDLVIIEKGLNRAYPCETTPRVFEFQATILTDDRLQLLDDVKQCRGIQRVTSVYMGTMIGIVVVKEVDWLDGFCDSVQFQFTITEIAE